MAKPNYKFAKRQKELAKKKKKEEKKQRKLSKQAEAQEFHGDDEGTEDSAGEDPAEEV